MGGVQGAAGGVAIAGGLADLLFWVCVSYDAGGAGGGRGAADGDELGCAWVYDPEAVREVSG